MNKTDLVTGYSLFGGKGDVWSKTAHIFKNGFDPNTLCGKPMLSTNWVHINGVTDVGCPECIRLYKEQQPEPKFFCKNIEVNNKKIEVIDIEPNWNVSRYDNDRQKYTYSEDFEDVEIALKKYDELRDAEFEKMNHQF